MEYQVLVYCRNHIGYYKVWEYQVFVYCYTCCLSFMGWGPIMCTIKCKLIHYFLNMCFNSVRSVGGRIVDCGYTQKTRKMWQLL